ncbi:MAG: ISAs1 family transposase [Spirulina sp.]
MLNSIIEGFKKIKDFRKKRGKRHELWVVLAIIFLGMMAGNVNYQQIARFSQNEKDNLIKWLGIPQGKIPSYSTIRRVMMGINIREIKVVYEDLVEKYYWKKEDTDWIAIDGKTLKNTLTNYEDSGQNVLIVISGFSPATKLVIKSEEFESQKSSENAKVRNIIRESGWMNKVLTLDALHCSQQTTRTIIETGNDYLITVKRNQKKLYTQIEELTERKNSVSEYQKTDGCHGREVTRTVSVFNAESLGNEKYPHIVSVIRINRKGWRGKKEWDETLYYISSQKMSAQIFALKIQEHCGATPVRFPHLGNAHQERGVENQVHWVKDVIFKEDKSRIRNCQVAAKFSLLITLIMNLYRSCGFVSISQGQAWLGKDWQKMLLI